MNSVFNTDRFVTAVRSLDTGAFTGRDLEFASARYIQMQDRIRSAFGEHFNDTLSSLSSVADAILARLGLPRKFTVVVELVVLQFFLEEIIDSVQSRGQNRTQDSKVSGGQGVYCHEIGWEQGSVRHSGGRRQARKVHSV